MKLKFLGKRIKKKKEIHNMRWGSNKAMRKTKARQGDGGNGYLKESF